MMALAALACPVAVVAFAALACPVAVVALVRVVVVFSALVSLVSMSLQ